ncbi:MAG TPA: CHAT domain-containing tetratricopeptide repeat protein [Candidatus Deferrimicrobium sp.]|nr:CHAT domain-containing tetratricopeptide repeat protein [Candidatus Deferrimicrobium sp.]
MKLHRISFVICLSFISVDCVGQTWKALLDQADSAYQRWEFDSSISLAQLALDSAASQLGPEDTIVARIWSSLGRCHYFQGNQMAAESCLRKSLEIRQRILGPDDPEVAKSLSGLAAVYASWNKLADAEQLYRRAQTIQETKLGADHPDLITTFNNLAIVYATGRDFVQAEQLFQKALIIKEKHFGLERRELASEQASLASVYAAQGRFPEAEDVYLRHIKNREKVHGANHPWLCNGLRGLANVYFHQGNYVAAESLLQRCLAIDEHTFGSSHRDVAVDLQEISRLCRKQGEFTRALASASRAVTIAHRDLLDNARVLSESDVLRYSRYLRQFTNNYLSCFHDTPDSQRPSPFLVGDIIVATKGQVSEGLFERQKSLVLENDPDIQKLADELNLMRRQAARIYFRGESPNARPLRDTLESLAAVIKEREADLARRSASFRRLQEHKPITVDRILSLLPDTVGLIEYVRYEYTLPDRDSVEPRYLALCLSSSENPQLKDIGPAADIDSLVEDYRNHFKRLSQSGVPSPADETAYRQVARTLSEKVFKPLLPSLSDKQLILIAPDGALNIVSFGSLIDDQNNYLIERHAVHFLTAGRDLIRLQDLSRPGSGLLAFGDPDYEAVIADRSLQLPIPTEHVSMSVNYPSIPTRSGVSGFSLAQATPLPNTRREVQAVAESWAARWQESTRVYLGPDASEEKLKVEASGKRVIHLATHGYFLEPAPHRETVSEKAADDDHLLGQHPLLLSGLLLAGANCHEPGTDSIDSEDGILTAYEVAGMNLYGTEWVVLSACESGLGVITTGEGVYGLRRSFQMAGARTVISSLWPVPDKQTVSFMRHLYSSQEKSLAEMMRTVALKQISDIRRRNLPDHPYTWGAFVATGEWRLQR